jgi:4-hydroxy-tetrahydrodipicolinate synthase
MTPFRPDGALDEQSLRAHLRRIVASGNGVFLGSPGAGEGHALSLVELGRLYEIAVEECKGKVPVHANPRDSRTAEEVCEIAQIALSAGVDEVMVYQLTQWHGMVPTAREQEAYFREILEAVRGPVALSVGQSLTGYHPSVSLLRDLQRDYPHIAAILPGPPWDYFGAVRDALPDSVRLYTSMPDVLQSFVLGATGCFGAEANIIPKTCHRIIEHYAAGANDELGDVVRAVQRFGAICRQWGPGYARYVKMALKVLGLPGGNGILRKPYVLPADDELNKMSQAFQTLGIRKLEGLD